MRYFLISAMVLGSITIGSLPVEAKGCDGLTVDQCRAQISEIDRAIDWLQRKKREKPQETEVALQECQEGVPPSADLSVVINCMLDKLGP